MILRNQSKKRSELVLKTITDLIDIFEKMASGMRSAAAGLNVPLNTYLQQSANGTNVDLFLKELWESLWTHEELFYENVQRDNDRKDMPEEDPRRQGFARVIDLIERREGIVLGPTLSSLLPRETQVFHLLFARIWAKRHWQPNRRKITSRDELLTAIRNYEGNNDSARQIIARYGYPESWIFDNVTDFTTLFHWTPQFNEPIGTWDTTDVVRMQGTFADTNYFNKYIGKWNTSNVTTMCAMFSNTIAFNQNINQWDTSSVINMSFMFDGAQRFNQPLDNWNVENVRTVDSMFANTLMFNQPLNSWSLLDCALFSRMFQNAQRFNQPLHDWRLPSAVDMDSMFAFSRDFNQQVQDWMPLKLQMCTHMFLNANAFQYHGLVGTAWSSGDLKDLDGPSLRYLQHLAAMGNALASEENHKWDAVEFEAASIVQSLFARHRVTV